MIAINEIKLVDVNSLKGHPKNPNMHTDEQIDHLAKQYAYQGIRTPIIVSKLSGYIVAGHGRMLAAKRANIGRVPVSFQDFKDTDQEFAFMVADNAVSDWAVLDKSLINAEIATLGPDFDLDMLGIEDFKLDPAENATEDEANSSSTSTTFATCPECGYNFEVVKEENE